jgi:pyrimidine operon attenuation protein/uracil phosphoribosyltransferase
VERRLFLSKILLHGVIWACNLARERPLRATSVGRRVSVGHSEDICLRFVFDGSSSRTVESAA